MEKDASYGIIPLRNTGFRAELFVIKHRAGHWGFPKGHPKDNSESPQQTAERELREETGLLVSAYLACEPFVIVYECVSHGKQVNKTVTLFVAEVSGNVRLCPIEIETGEWFTLENAIEKITFKDVRAIIEQVKGVADNYDNRRTIRSC